MSRRTRLARAGGNPSTVGTAQEEARQMTEPRREDAMLDDAREKVEQDKHRESRGNARSRALPLTFFDDLSDSPSPKLWIIKNVMARNETSSWISPPGKGKSALLTDIAVHVAAGEDWRGHRV